MKTIALFASISIASGLMFANVYTSLVDAKSWGSDIPGSIAAAREYFKTVSPANFFRIFSPLNQMLALAVLVLFWKSSSPIRMCLAAALVLYVLTDVMTFAYFYPRNEIMFRAAQLNDVTLLRETWASWSAMNLQHNKIIIVQRNSIIIALHNKIIKARQSHGSDEASWLRRLKNSHNLSKSYGSSRPRREQVPFAPRTSRVRTVSALLRMAFCRKS